MEKDIALGSVGKLDLSFSNGKAMITVAVTLPGGLSSNVSIQEDASVLFDLIEAAAVKALPASQPIDQVVFPVLKSAVLAIA